MGLILSVRCVGCGYEADGLRLGGSHEQIAEHDVSAYELFASPCCKQVESVRVLLGARYPEAECGSCAQSFEPTQETRFRVSTLKGEVFSGHSCPRCSEPRLEFSPIETFL